MATADELTQRGTQGDASLDEEKYDSEFIAKVLKHEPTATNALVKLVTQLVNCNVRHSGSLRIEFDDLVQDVLYRVLCQDRLRHVDCDNGSFVGWLRTVVRNTNVSSQRNASAHKRGGQWLFIEDIDSSLHPAFFSNVEEQIHAKSTLELFRAHLAEDEQCLLMSLAEGNSYDEIAKKLSITGAAIRQRIHRFRARLDKLSSDRRPFPRTEESETPLKILLVATDAGEKTHSAVMKEYEQIRSKLRACEQIKILTKQHSNLNVIIDYVKSFQPQVLHLSGHGKDGGEMANTNGHRNEVLLDTSHIQELIEVNRMRCILLDSCCAHAQTDSLAENVEAVVRVQNSLPIAATFSSAFYKALGAGESVRNAHRLGTFAIRDNTDRDLCIPQLFSYLPT